MEKKNQQQINGQGKCKQCKEVTTYEQLRKYQGYCVSCHKKLLNKMEVEHFNRMSSMYSKHGIKMRF